MTDPTRHLPPRTRRFYAAQVLRVLALLAGGGAWMSAASNATGTMLYIGGADAASAYTARVKAKHSMGQSPWTTSAPAAH